MLYVDNFFCAWPIPLADIFTVGSIISSSTTFNSVFFIEDYYFIY